MDPERRLIFGEDRMPEPWATELATKPPSQPSLVITVTGEDLEQVSSADAECPIARAARRAFAAAGIDAVPEVVGDEIARFVLRWSIGDRHWVVFLPREANGLIEWFNHRSSLPKFGEGVVWRKHYAGPFAVPFNFTPKPMEFAIQPQEVSP